MTSETDERAYPSFVRRADHLRLVRWLERVLLCFAVLLFCLHSLPRAWRTLNTDFPNYYLAARLAHEHYDTSRMYEWSWIEREKDHRRIDIRVIGLLPITPFSTLAVLPFVGMSPLGAKHMWIVLNVALLVPLARMLRQMTGLSYRRIALVILLSFPLYRNLLYGQFYVILLCLITAACFSYIRGHPALAGAILAIAAVCKVFPLLLFVFFLQRREWRAVVWGALTGACAIALSIAVFGVAAHLTWMQQILPWVMRGEALGTYANAASISGVLHCLFLSEPQWNPHPWRPSPLVYALLAPSLQMIALAPAILLIRRKDQSNRRILLEWSALLTAALAISTIPASYNFVLMILPVCVLASVLLRGKRYGWLFALTVAYLGIGLPIPVPNHPLGLALLLYVPRLPLMLAVLLGIYRLLWRDAHSIPVAREWTRYAWTVAMAFAVAFSIRSTLHTERAERQEYAFRLPLDQQGLLNSSPQSTGDALRYIAFTLNGYQLITGSWKDPQLTHYSPLDELSFTSGSGHLLVERASAPGSQISGLSDPWHTVVDGARNPMLSADGHDLAFIRDARGSGQLFLRPSYASASAERPLTNVSLNVYEATFLSASDYAFAATANGGRPRIFLTDAAHINTEILPLSRYPALSPNGRWLAYSHLQHGVWNLWLRDQTTGVTHQIADLPCNQIQPAWEPDSQTLLYATDCGRSLWFTAVARRRVAP